MLRAFRISRAKYGTDHSYSRKIADSIDELYKKWNRPDALKSWRSGMEN